MMMAEIITGTGNTASQIAWMAVVGVGEYAMVTMAVIIDLWSGLRNARRRGVRTSSRGLRRSVSKLGSYLTLLVLLSIVDTVAAAATIYFRSHGHAMFPPFPWLTSLGSLAQVIIEAKSVIENTANGDKLLSLGKRAWRLATRRLGLESTG